MPSLSSGTAGAGGSNVHELDPNTNVNSQPSDTKGIDHRPNGNEVVIMSEDDRTSSFFSQPGILAGEYTYRVEGSVGVKNLYQLKLYLQYLLQYTDKLN